MRAFLVGCARPCTWVILRSMNPTCQHTIEFENGYAGALYAAMDYKVSCRCSLRDALARCSYKLRR